MGDDVSVTIEPKRVRLDEPFAIRVEGLNPGQRVELVAEVGWTRARGRASFDADGTGTVDLTRQAPVDGDYRGVRSMGLIELAHPRQADVELEPEDHTSPVKVDARIEGHTVATATAQQVRRSESVERHRVDEEGLVADLHLPPGAGPHPGVIVFGGSEGGIPTVPEIDLLAAEGYAVLAAAYLQPPEVAYGNAASDDRNWATLPEQAVQVPLEYAESAVTWFGNHPAVRADTIGVVGFSIGSSLALLVASRREEVRAAVAVAPGGIVFEGISTEPGPAGAMFAENGESLPHITYRSFRQVLQMIWHRLRNRPIELREWYDSGLNRADEAEIEAATIPVEQVGGPVLLVSGSDDRLWNAARYGNRLIDRLDRHGYEHPYEHLVCEEAGHALEPPYLPCRGRSRIPFFMGLDMALGGTAEGYADAATEYWPRVLETLRIGTGDSPA